MSSLPEPLSEQAIRAALCRVALVREVVYLPSVSSTNDVAHRLAEHGAPNASLIVADDQVAGRGRLSRAWYMAPRSAIAMSLVVRPQLEAARAQRLTLLAGLAAAEGIEQVTGLPAQLKWPNDVVMPNAERGWLKMGGILTETSIAGSQVEYAVIGIGLNINVRFDDQPHLAETATSVMQQLGHEVDRLSVLAAVVERFAFRYDWLGAGDALRAAWSARLATLGRRVEARLTDTVLFGLAEAVDADGALLLRADDGRLHRLLAADVIVLR